MFKATIGARRTCNKMHACNKMRFIAIALLVVIFLTVPWRNLQLPRTNVIGLLGRVIVSEKIDITSEKIVIGLITCSGGVSTLAGQVEKKALWDATEEALTMMKSVILSAKLSKVGYVDFHIFVDNWKLKEAMKNRVDKYVDIMKGYVTISVLYYNVFDSVPNGHERDYIDSSRRCGYVRIFFPDSLPVTVKQILYFDTDIIVTGSILHIWQYFLHEVVHKPISSKSVPKLAGMVQNSEVFGNLHLDVYKDHFRMIPHVPPRGVNSGVMFMNLEAMREFNWTSKMSALFIKMRASMWGDQRLINMFFHDNLDKLTMFPCQYNFHHLHCDKGLTCRNLTTDPGGIQIMHGAGGTMHGRDRSHAALYSAFHEFNLEKHAKVIEDLYLPVRRFYSETNSTTTKVSCRGTIGKYLFTHLVE